MWSQKSDGNLPGSSRLGSGRSDRGSEQRNGPGQQSYNAWDRAARPGSGRGAHGDRNSATSPGASVSSTSSPSLSPTSPSAGGGLVPEHRIRPGALNLVPGRMCTTASCLTSPEQQERRQSLKISFSQPNILMKKSVSMGLNFPGFSQVSQTNKPHVSVFAVSQDLTQQHKYFAETLKYQIPEFQEGPTKLGFVRLTNKKSPFWNFRTMSFWVKPNQKMHE